MRRGARLILGCIILVFELEEEVCVLGNTIKQIWLKVRDFLSCKRNCWKFCRVPVRPWLNMLEISINSKSVKKTQCYMKRPTRRATPLLRDLFVWTFGDG